MYIFLDFDGVLKPLTEGNTPNVFNRDCLDAFENVVRRYDNIKIVISSTWKLAFSLSEIRQFFSPDIQKLIVGITPDTTGQITPYERHKEVLSYLRNHNDEDAKRVAIDDDPEHFHDNCPVIITNPYEGFNESIALKLIGMIEG